MQRLWFFDDRHVRARYRVERCIHPPVKHPANPLMKPEAVWEKGHSFSWPTVLYDAEERLFKCWYEALTEGAAYGAYAVSPDGIHWERPILKQVAFKGSKVNNLFYRGTYRRGPGIPICPCVIKRAPGDWHMYYWDALRPSGPAGVIHYIGEDGLHWRRGRRNPVVQTPVDRTHSGGVEDVLRVSYDAIGRKFLLSQRTLPLENLERPMLQKVVPGGLTQRRVSLATSRDGDHFSPMRTVLVPGLNDPWDSQFYGLSPFRYADFFLGYLLCYRTGTPCMDVELVYSPDGAEWTRVAPNVRYIANGLHNEPDCGLIHCASAPVLVGDHVFTYYYGTNSDHAKGTVNGQPICGTLCLAIAEAGRFVSARALDREGAVLIGPVRLRGGTVTLDARAPSGELRVALRRAETFDEIPDYALQDAMPLTGDSRAHRAAWRTRADSGRLRGRNVFLQVNMKMADLFSVTVE